MMISVQHLFVSLECNRRHVLFVNQMIYVSRRVAYCLAVRVRMIDAR